MKPRMIWRWGLMLSVMTGLALSATALAAEIDMSGVWKGTYGTDDPEVEARLIITIKKAGARYSGTISLPDEKINVSIRQGSMEDGYFSVTGVLPTKGMDGKMVQAHVTFGGFMDEDSPTWDGNWTVTDKDGNVAAGNIFTASRATKPRPTGGDDEEKITPPKPEKPQPGPKIAVSGAGLWKGSYNASNQTSGSLTIVVKQANKKFTGTGVARDNDGTDIPAITFTAGKMAGQKLTLLGSMMALGEDGEEIPASVRAIGDITADAWRGTLTVKPEAEDTAGLSITFRLKRVKEKPAPEIEDFEDEDSLND